MKEKHALIVIDVQNYFVNKHTKGLPRKIADCIRKTPPRHLLFTQFINKRGSHFWNHLDFKECVNPPDTNIHTTLIPFTNANNVFQKTSYSIFKCPALVRYLKKNNIRCVSLCGIDTDACLLASAYDGFDLGYSIKVLKNLSASHYGVFFHRATLKIVSKNLVR